MILFPAIDILDGKAVRLTKGDFEDKKVYDEDPLSAARGWSEGGAKYLHVVDLDGARSGEPANLEHLRRISRELGLPVQFGGGLRTSAAIDQALQAGAARVILGTAAFTDPDLLERALVAHGPDRVLVSIDVRAGSVTTSGWTESTNLSANEVIEGLWERGVRELVYTNVDRDGMLEGPDLQEIAALGAIVRASFIYSGGIGHLSDLEGLRSLKEDRLAGVIVGKALYEGRFTIEQAQAALRG
ncbi:MAG TPA: 1-(5-phosphoribosyl)-5-[(5-phosphoribosylamino)methylideneamino]imidazole-4-carboxamide isomerase [Solirubrobacteraceae bacterium]|jgi:phosphoribosylformimino-5-aminoimidazole carboxamide ribotide isomerase